MPLDSFLARRRRTEGTSLRQLGMVLVLVSISVLFVAAGIAVLITNHQARVWRAPDQTGLPWGTAASTALLAVVSWQLQSALVSIRNNRFTDCAKGWRNGSIAALVFLFVQALNARWLASIEGAQASQTLFVFCYDLLVGLHAAHVLGGFVPLALVYAKLRRRDYSSSRYDGLLFCVQYWHYLGLVWLVLLGILLWVG